MEKVVAEAFEEFFPTSEDWIEFQPYQTLGKISTRIAAEVIVGPTFCGNQIWLNIAFNYTENLFRTIVVLRFFPSWTHSLIRFLLPSYWKGRKVLYMAKQLLGPRIQELLNQSDAGTWEPQDSNADDINVLCWLSFMAKGRDRNPDTIAHVLVLVALGAVHTTLLRMVNVLYDVTTAGPNLLKELLDEIRSVEDKGWTGAFSYDQLHRLDSVICESQRLSPPTILGMKRLFRESYTFQDGTHIPSGSYACMSIHAIENNNKHTPYPELFNGLRNFHARQEQQHFDNAGKISDKLFLFSTPRRTAISFGYGKSACPGRFFASYVIKMVVVKMLTEYEFNFLPGTERPVNILIHEFLFTWPWQKMLIRRRRCSRPV
ncbi:Cytochrome P450, partial [Metarhizium majus ARSEF 297]